MSKVKAFETSREVTMILPDGLKIVSTLYTGGGDCPREKYVAAREALLRRVQAAGGSVTTEPEA